ncbi:MAG: RNA-binding protein [Leptospiraceae bacterium]|nr:RNA-binding protein [Leptospiraceae bacterium]
MQVYVGNLNFATTNEALNEFFSSKGEVVKVRIITDKETGRSMGYGFVEMADEGAARDAIAELDGQELDGRKLRINEARRKEERGGPRHRH